MPKTPPQYHAPPGPAAGHTDFDRDLRLSGSAADSTIHIGFILLQKFSMFSLSSLVEPLRIANYCSGKKLYDWSFLSADGKAVPTSTGVPVPTQPITSDESTWDAVIICGGWNAERYESAELFSWLQHMGRTGIMLGATETGSYILARAGLLQGYAATIHWHCHNAFKERHPGIELKDALYVIDRKRMTCAGGAAGLDMMLHEIGCRSGKELALEVADQLLYTPVREAELAQKSAHSRTQAALPPTLQKAIDIMEKNIEKPLTIPQISRMLGFSQRKLERMFDRHFACSAVAFYRTVRLQEARVLLTHTDLSVLDICIACGFASSSYFSKSYTQQFGVRPRDHRTSWPDSEATPYWPGISTFAAASSNRNSKQGS